MADEEDQKLSQLLVGWKVDAALPPRFEERVWRSIAHGEVEAPGTWWTAVQNWVQSAMPRPALAMAYTVILLAVGGMAGYWQAESKSARIDQTLGDRYAQSVVPITLAQR